MPLRILDDKGVLKGYGYNSSVYSKSMVRNGNSYVKVTIVVQVM